MLDSPTETADPHSADETDLASSMRDVDGEIKLLYRTSNTIRRASEESHNLRAATSYRIRDDHGNDAEPMLQELFANYIRSRFPSINDCLCLRLAFSMVLRRRKILYRRSRYGTSPIRTSETISQPQIEMPRSQSQGPVVIDLAEEATSAPANSIVRSLAPSATTLAVEQYKRASTPSVVSAAKTVALGNDEELIFPPAPTGRIKARYRLLRKQRRESHQEYLASLLEPFEIGKKTQLSNSQYDHVAIDPNGEHHAEILAAESKLRDGLESDWNDCHKAVPEVICPFCFYALPSLSISDNKKWKYVIRSCTAELMDTKLFSVPTSRKISTRMYVFSMNATSQKRCIGIAVTGCIICVFTHCVGVATRRHTICRLSSRKTSISAI